MQSLVTDQPPSTTLPRTPKAPLVTIEPSKSWMPLNLRDLWAHRELLYFLVWRDVKVRYKQTLLGAAWAILQPLLMTLVFSLFFSRFGTTDPRIPYPLFALAGLVPWTFFATAVSSSANSMLGNANLVTKIYFPRLIVPAASVVAGLVDLAFAFLPLIGMMIYYRVQLSLNILMLPVLVAFTTLFAFAIGTYLSALNVKYRDIRFVLPFLIQIWLFVSSVIVPVKALPQRFLWIFYLNPMSTIIESYRSALFGSPFDWRMLGISGAITLVVMFYAAYSFKRVEQTFADII